MEAKKRVTLKDEQIRKTAAKKNSRRKNLTVSSQNTMREACTLMASHKLDALCVTENDQLVGIITDKDIVFKAIAENMELTVAGLMTSNPVTVQDSTKMTQALAKMVSCHFRHLPILKGKTISGMLDITKCLFEALEKLDRADEATRKMILALESFKEFGGNQTMNMVDAIQSKLKFPLLSEIVKNKTAPIISQKATVREAAKLMKSLKETAVLVCEDSKILGILTTKDICLRVVAASLDPTATSVVRVMTPHPDCFQSGQTSLDALKQMHTKKYLHIPVLSGQNVLGLVDVLELTLHVLKQLESMNQNDQLFNQIWGDNLDAENSFSVDDSFLSSPSMNPISVKPDSSFFAKSSVNESTSIKVKSSKGTFILESVESFSKVQEQVQNRIGTSTTLHYFDEGDKVIVDSDESLRRAVTKELPLIAESSNNAVFFASVAAVSFLAVAFICYNIKSKLAK